MRLNPDLANTLLDLAPDATVIVDAAGTIVFANAQMERTFGYSPRELIGMPVETLLPNRFRSGHTAHREHFAARPRPRPMGEGLRLFGQHKSGREFPVEVSLSPVESDGGTLVVAAVRDATARHDAERELIEANRAKSRLLAAASHDLRQPVQTLNLLHQAALRHVGENATLRAVLQGQRNALDTMASLLSSVLDVSKLDSGALQPTIGPQPLCDVLARLRSDFEPHAAAKGLALLVESTDEGALTDPELLGRLLGNLVSNAIHYTERGSVSLTCRRVGGELAIVVSDTGSGMPSHELTRIFEEFYQIDSGPKRSEGLGLGLSIVRRLAKLLGHSVSVDSTLGEGTSFTVTMPRADIAPSARPRERAAARRAHRGTRVLVVDDEPTVAHATSLLLELEGFDVAVAHGLEDALAHARERAPDIIVSDFHLRGTMTGADVVAAVRADVGAAVPAIFVTGDTSKFARAGTKMADTCVLSKPTRAEELLAAVHAQLGRRSEI